MKYVLAKDLPFAKAGSKIKIEFNEILIKTEEGSPFGYHQYSDQFLQHLIDCGWIKEVKPREFYVRVSKNIPISICEDLEPLKDFSNEIIKVREVLE